MTQPRFFLQPKKTGWNLTIPKTTSEARYLQRVGTFAAEVDQIRSNFQKHSEQETEKKREKKKRQARFRYGVCLKEGPDQGRSFRAEFAKGGTELNGTREFVTRSPLITPIPRTKPFILQRSPLDVRKVPSPTLGTWVSMPRKT